MRFLCPQRCYRCRFLSDLLRCDGNLQFFSLPQAEKDGKPPTPPAAYNVVNGMNYLHEGNKCQLRIGPLTKQTSYRCYLRHSVCVNEHIKPPVTARCLESGCSFFTPLPRAVKYKLQVTHTITWRECCSWLSLTTAVEEAQHRLEVSDHLFMVQISCIWP